MQSIYLNIARWAVYVAVYCTFLLTLVGHLTSRELSASGMALAVVALVVGPLERRQFRAVGPLYAGLYFAAMVVSQLPNAVWVPSRQRA